MDGKEKLLVKQSFYFLGFFIFPKLDKFLKHGERKKTYIEILNVHKSKGFMSIRNLSIPKASVPMQV